MVVIINNAGHINVHQIQSEGIVKMLLFLETKCIVVFVAFEMNSYRGKYRLYGTAFTYLRTLFIGHIFLK